jgi:hypothetical protein
MDNLKRMLLIQHPFFLRLIFRELRLIRVDLGAYLLDLAGSPPKSKKITITFCNMQDGAEF